jgi:hypothetical protein
MDICSIHVYFSSEVEEKHIFLYFIRKCENFLLAEWLSIKLFLWTLAVAHKA